MVTDHQYEKFSEWRRRKFLSIIEEQLYLPGKEIERRQCECVESVEEQQDLNGQKKKFHIRL